MSGLNHFDARGNAIMVDVSQKPVTERLAVACGKITMNEAAFEAIKSGTAKKGDVRNVARIAGIMAAKRTSDTIPMCHPVALTKCAVDFELFPDTRSVEARCTAGVSSQTGVEMEALCGVSAALLTIYDMCKALDPSMVMGDICLQYKSGGRSGEFVRAK